MTCRRRSPVRVIRPETAITMRQMMEGVVLHGTGTRARLAGYTVGGKTGSAQIFDFATRHYTHTYNGSFMGFAPVTNPAIVVVVTLNGTHGDGRLRRRGGGPGVPRGGDGGAAGAGRAQGPAGRAVPRNLAKRRRSDDLADADDSPDGPNILEDSDDDDSPRPRTPQPAGRPQGAEFPGHEHAGRAGGSGRQRVAVLPDGSGIARVQTPRAGRRPA